MLIEDFKFGKFEVLARRFSHGMATLLSKADKHY